MEIEGLLYLGTLHCLSQFPIALQRKQNFTKKEGGSGRQSKFLESAYPHTTSPHVGQPLVNVSSCAWLLSELDLTLHLLDNQAHKPPNSPGQEGATSWTPSSNTRQEDGGL